MSEKMMRVQSARLCWNSGCFAALLLMLCFSPLCAFRLPRNGFVRAVFSNKARGELNHSNKLWMVAPEPSAYELSKIESMLHSSNIAPAEVQQLFQRSTKGLRSFQSGPLENFGCIFQLDCLVDVEVLFKQAWDSVAEAHKLPPPSMEDVKKSMGLSRPDAVRRTFRWTKDYAKALDLAREFKEALDQACEVGEDPGAWAYRPRAQPGAEETLRALRSEGCTAVAAVARLPQRAAGLALHAAGLLEYVRKGVFLEDGHGDAPGSIGEVAAAGAGRDAQAYLKAALKLRLPPEDLYVFDHRPEGLTEAKDAGMKAVGLLGPYRNHELPSADLVVPGDFAGFRPGAALRRLVDIQAEPELQLQLQLQTQARASTRTGVATATRAAAAAATPSQEEYFRELRANERYDSADAGGAAERPATRRRAPAGGDDGEGGAEGERRWRRGAAGGGEGADDGWWRKYSKEGGDGYRPGDWRRRARAAGEAGGAGAAAGRAGPPAYSPGKGTGKWNPDFDELGDDDLRFY